MIMLRRRLHSRAVVLCRYWQCTFLRRPPDVKGADVAKIGKGV
jgi:hypothetical protein